MKTITALCLVLALFGCSAKSPQQVQVQPDLTAANGLKANGEVVHLEVIDSREDKVLGTRGGVYEKTSLITLSSDFTSDVEEVLKSKMTDSGFTLGGDTSNIKWKVNFKELTYKIEKKSALKNVVTVFGDMSINIVAGNKTFNNFYQTTFTQEVLNTPSDKKNNQMINTAISNLLTLMLEDKTISEFLL